MAFALSSSSLQDGGTVPDKHVFSSFGCTGGNLSPELHWSGAPHETKSFALTVYDPDAPTGSGWWHWTVVNIPHTASAISGRREPPREVGPAGRRGRGADGFRQRGLWRALPTGRRQAAPLHLQRCMR